MENFTITGIPASPRPRHEVMLTRVSAVAAVLLLAVVAGSLFAALHRGTTTSPWLNGPLIPNTNDSGLNSIVMVAPNDGWAAGYSNQIAPVGTGIGTTNNRALLFHYNGHTWQSLDTARLLPGIVGIYSLSFVTPNNGWAIGWSLHYKQSMLLHYDGKRWQRASFAASYMPGSVQMLAQDNGWAIGTQNGSMGQAAIFHYDGITWQQQQQPLPTGVADVQSLSMLSSQEGWALANGPGYDVSNDYDCYVLHYIQGQWQVQYTIHSTKSEQIRFASRELSMVSATEGWGAYVVYRLNAADQYYLLHYHNGRWSSMHAPVSSEPFPIENVVMRTADDGWLTGMNFKRDDPYTHLQEPIQVQFAHYDGTSWHLVNGPNITGFSQSHITALAFSEPNEAWATGFRDMPATQTANIHGDRAFLLHYLNGQWTVYAQ